jgi:catalase
MGPLDVKHDQWVNGQVQLYSSEVVDDDYQQARDLWEIYKKQNVDQVFIDNLCGNISKALPEVRKEAVGK